MTVFDAVRRSANAIRRNACWAGSSGAAECRWHPADRRDLSRGRTVSAGAEVDHRRRSVAIPALLIRLPPRTSGKLAPLGKQDQRAQRGLPCSSPRLSGKPGGWREVVLNRQQLDFGGDQISPAKRSIAARQPYTTSFLRRPARVCGFSTRPFLCPTATAESERRSRSSDCVTEAIDKRTRAMDEAERPPARTRMPTRVVVG